MRFIVVLLFLAMAPGAFAATAYPIGVWPPKEATGGGVTADGRRIYERLVEVLTRQPVWQFKDLPAPEDDPVSPEASHEWARKADVDAILTGTLHRWNGDVTLQLRLIGSHQGRVLWHQTWNGPASGVEAAAADMVADLTKRTEQQDIPLSINLQKGEGVLHLLSSPPGASLILDGKWMGRAPLTVRGVGLGQHQVQAQIENRVENQMLTIKTVPGGVPIYLDGQPAGGTPVTLEALKPDQEYHLKMGAQRVESDVLIETQPSGGTVVWSGEEKGTTPLRLTNQMREETRVLVRGPIRLQTRSMVQVPGPAPQEVALDLFEVGRIIVNSRVPDARIYLDGQFEGTAPLTLFASPGSHRVTVTQKGFQPVHFDAQLKAGEAVEQTVDLAIDRQEDSGLLLFATGELHDGPGAVLQGVIPYPWGDQPLQVLRYGAEFNWGMPGLYRNGLLSIGAGLGLGFRAEPGGVGLAFGGKLQLLEEGQGGSPLSAALGWAQDPYLGLSRQFATVTVDAMVSLKGTGLALRYNRWPDWVVGAVIGLGWDWKPTVGGRFGYQYPFGRTY